MGIGGTAESPTLRGTRRLGGWTIRRFPGPLHPGRLRLRQAPAGDRLLLWRTGENVLESAHLPLDLALTRRGATAGGRSPPVQAQARQRGPRNPRGADPGVRRVRGLLDWTSMSRAPGTPPARWGGGDPGRRHGRAGLGVRFGSVAGGRCPGRFLVLRDVRISSGGGTLAIDGVGPAGGPGPAGAQPRLPGQRVPGDGRPQLPHPRPPPATSSCEARSSTDAHRQPHGEQRRALFRRPGEQADHRSRGPHHRRPGRHHPPPAGGSRAASSRTGSSIPSHRRTSGWRWEPTCGSARPRPTFS